jgi:hypothetical protein
MVNISTASDKSYQFQTRTFPQFVGFPFLPTENSAITLHNNGIFLQTELPDISRQVRAGTDFFFFTVADDFHTLPADQSVLNP